MNIMRRTVIKRRHYTFVGIVRFGVLTRFITDRHLFSLFGLHWLQYLVNRVTHYLKARLHDEVDETFVQ